MWVKSSKWIKRIALLSIFISALYGLGRLYYQVTGGFTMGNITSDFPYNPSWETRPLTNVEKNELNVALSQTYRYLGKGCQSYVFSSDDNKYVLKFFKYQRYRLQPWLTILPSITPIENYRQRKILQKEKKRDGFFNSWKIAFDNLKDETGLVYVHLNKSQDLQKQVVIVDKIGLKHLVNLDDMEFLVQRKAQMLCPTLIEFRDKGDLDGAKVLIGRLFAMILSEYERGFADNDHALMQNTGVFEGNPIHIDVGQFVKNEDVMKAEVYNVELFTKTYKFRIWLKKEYPELAQEVDLQLQKIIGPDFSTIKPKFRTHQ